MMHVFHRVQLARNGRPPDISHRGRSQWRYQWCRCASLMASEGCHIQNKRANATWVAVASSDRVQASIYKCLADVSKSTLLRDQKTDARGRCCWRIKTKDWACEGKRYGEKNGMRTCWKEKMTCWSWHLTCCLWIRVQRHATWSNRTVLAFVACRWPSVVALQSIGVCSLGPKPSINLLSAK
jgi:hypothetical protein